MKKVLVTLIALMSMVTLSAQDLTAVYNEAAAALNERDFKTAVEKFQQLISEGLDSEENASLVATAKSAVPMCYFRIGGAAVQAQNWDEALKNFSMSAELADLYGDVAQMTKSKQWVANVYQKLGSDAFNSKDYAAAAEVFAKGYDVDPRNTSMALNLATSYCELAMVDGNMELYQKGMDIFENVAAMTAPKFADDAAKAQEMLSLYTNNMVAKLQGAGNHDAIIAMTDQMLVKNPLNEVAQKVRVQAYASKADYAKVIELAPEAADIQASPEDQGLIYLMLGAAYNAKEMKPQAIEAFRKVTAGPALEEAKKVLAELTK